MRGWILGFSIAAILAVGASFAVAQTGRYFEQRDLKFNDLEFLDVAPTLANASGTSFFDVWAHGAKNSGASDSVIISYLRDIPTNVGECKWAPVTSVVVSNPTAQLFFGGGRDKEYIAASGECRNRQGGPYQTLYFYLAGTSGKHASTCTTYEGRTPQPDGEYCAGPYGCYALKPRPDSSFSPYTVNCAAYPRLAIEHISSKTASAAVKQIFPGPPGPRVLCIQSCYKRDPDADFAACERSCPADR